MSRRLMFLPALVVAGVTLAACGGEDEAADTAASATEAAGSEMSEEMTSESMTEEMESSEMMSEDMTEEMTSGAEDPNLAAGPVGPGCAAYAEAVPDGAGSVEGMALDPVAVAASNNPILTTLTAAVSGGLNPQVNLVDTLNGAEFTVFAPVDDAFAKVDPATIETLKTDADLLTTILTYHVVPGQVTPEDIAGSTQTSVQGGTVEVAGTPDNLTVNGNQVICGGVETANATVYLIDTVLMPPAAG